MAVKKSENGVLTHLGSKHQLIDTIAGMPVCRYVGTSDEEVCEDVPVAEHQAQIVPIEFVEVKMATELSEPVIEAACSVKLSVIVAPDNAIFKSEVIEGFISPTAIFPELSTDKYIPPVALTSHIPALASDPHTPALAQHSDILALAQHSDTPALAPASHKPALTPNLCIPALALDPVFAPNSYTPASHTPALATASHKPALDLNLCTPALALDSYLPSLAQDS